jgi:hypothetical protein
MPGPLSSTLQRSVISSGDVVRGEPEKALSSECLFQAINQRFRLKGLAEKAGSPAGHCLLL